MANQTKVMLFEIGKAKLTIEGEKEPPMKIYTIQLNERLIDGFEVTSLDTNFVIFKKSREEREIFRRFERRDCYFAILKPSMSKYIVDSPEIQKMHLKALSYFQKKQYDSLQSTVKAIVAKVRSTFKPGQILLSNLDTRRRLYQALKPDFTLGQ